MARKTEGRWVVVKDYVTDVGDNCTDTWCVVYGTKADAEQAKTRLEAGQDRSWFDPANNAFLYVDYMEGFSA
jgi:hypothetical protein